MITRYNTIIELLDNSFARYSDQPAYTCMGCTLSYAEINDLSLRFASYLRNEMGLKPGDRVAIQLPNILQYPVALYGVIRAGLVVVNVNPLYTPRELKHQLNDSGAKVLVVLSNVANSAASVIAETDVEHVILTNLADLHPTPKRQIVNFVVKYVKKLVPKCEFKHVRSFRSCLARAPQPYEMPEITPDTLFTLQYTGGTTGLAKGAMLTHGNLASNVWQLIGMMPGAFRESKEIYAACLPLYHIYALNVHALSAFSYGGHNILIPNPRDLNAFVDALKNVKLTVFVGINTLYVALCHFKRFAELDLSQLVVSCAGGMALTEVAAQTWEEKTGCIVLEGYGLTETSPVACGNRTGKNRPGTIGFPTAETELKVIGDSGEDLPAHEVGELCIRGPQVMKGYWNKPEETKSAIDSDGWFKTGDMAKIDEEGCVSIVDRKKDMILVSGFNVYPNEIEDVVTHHEKVLEAAAVGFACEKTGEAVRLFVVASDESLTEDELKAYCREHLTAYKVPKEFVFKDDLPKTNVGKILRRELRD